MTRGTWPALLLIAVGISTALAADQAQRSGLDFTTPGIRQMQQDDFANPGMLWVTQGQALWNEAQGAAGKSCAACHGAIGSMAGISFPKRGKDGMAVNLEAQIEQCRVERMQAPPLGFESERLLGLTAAIRHAMRGKPAPVAEDRAAIDAGARYYAEKRGRLDLACADCHERLVGKHLRDEVISQGQANGFPAYRLRWQGLGSLHRRFQVCNQAVGAEVSPLGSPEYIAVEWYLAWRGRNLPVETPGVRQ